MYYIFTFHSTHHAMASEKVCQNHLTCRLIPLPTVVHSGCGLALRVQESDVLSAKQLLKDHGIAYNHLYKMPDTKTCEVVE